MRASQWCAIRTRSTAARWTTRWPRRSRARVVRLGFRSVRFNFRGVGASQGEWDEGRGEIDDALGRHLIPP